MVKNSSRDLTDMEIGLMSAYFRALGEVSRLRLIFAVGYGEKNVSQLISETGLSQANVSKHLKILTESGILVRRQQGIFAYYSTANSSVFKLCQA